MSQVITDSKKINEILARNIERVGPPGQVKKLLLAGKKLRIKHGIDPTSPQIHLGNAVVLWKLRELQDLGHQIVLIIGDFTARIGDPSDKLGRRPVLTLKQIEGNLKTYKSQLGKILDLKKIEFRRNSEWLEALSAWDLVRLARLISAGQMLARRNFKQRYKAGDEIGIDEFLYPLLQGYDSFATCADIEVGGSDQLFNFEIGRRLQKSLGQKPQSYLICQMLLGLDGRKMSKSWGNVVNITDEPQEMFGKLMSLKDELIKDYLFLATRLGQKKIKALLKELERGKNPKEIKKILAGEIVKLYHNNKQAQSAQKEWENVFEKKERPTKLKKQVRLKAGTYNALDLVTRAYFAKSKSEAKRVIEQGGLRINGRQVVDWSCEFKVGSKPLLIQKGKKDFAEITTK
jgi:tyrosyl-tRNA synthetase